MKTITRDEVLKNGGFDCHNCKSRSKLSRLPEKPGLYKITCFNCKEVTYLRVPVPKKNDIVTVDLSNVEGNSTEENSKVEPKDVNESKPHDPANLNKFIEDVKKKVPLPKTKPDTKPVTVESSQTTSNPPPLFERKKVVSGNEPEKSRKKRFRDFLWEQNTPWILRSNKLLIAAILLLITALGILIPSIIAFTNASNELDVLLAELNKNKASHIFDRNGILISEIYQKKTGTSKLEDFPPALINIVLTVEDKNFYEHGGIDYIAIFRAFFRNISHMGYSQGASTITMQLSRILVKDRRKSLSRKIREAFIALALESKLSKKEILQAYLNQVYLGHGAFGFENGAMYYFNKTLKELNSKEMMLLSSLASAPNRYSPFKSPKLSKKRVKIITRTLIKNGLIPPKVADEIDDFYATLKPPPYRTVFGARYDEAPYVTEHVRGILQAVNPDKDIYYEGGFRIETTVILDIQKDVIKEVEAHVQKIVKSGVIKKVFLKKEDHPPLEDIHLQAATVGLDPRTGEVYFLHGAGDNFSSTNQFNRAIQMRRQTGSSIKPILYASAIDSGRFHTAIKVLDAPLLYRGRNGHEDWTPGNFGRDYEGEMFLREALMKSKNSVAVQVAESIGLPTVSKYFAKFFFPDNGEFNKRYREDLSVSLGSLEISPLEMASAYSSFANDGVIKRPFLIKRILSSKGKVLYSYEDGDEFQLKVPKERRAIDPDTAEVMYSLTSSSAGASAVRSTGYKGIVAGKTGTTNDYKDTWFVGYRPDIAMSIWIGYDDPSISMGPNGVGSQIPSPLWGTIMKAIDKYDVLPKRSFEFSKRAFHMRICKDSGERATARCPLTMDELFNSKTKAIGECKSSHGGGGDSIKSIFQ